MRPQAQAAPLGVQAAPWNLCSAPELREPIYELKMGFSLHGHYCAEHAAAWRQRVSEMREPPLGLDICPDAALDTFFDEIQAAPDTAALLVGLYSHTVPALREALERSTWSLQIDWWTIQATVFVASRTSS